METSEGSRGRMKISNTNSERTGCLGRFMALVLVVVLILGVTAFVGARTEGVRRAVENGLEQKLGMKLEIDKTRMGLPFALVVEGLESVEQDDRGPLLSIGELRVRPSLQAGRDVSVSRAVLRLHCGEGDAWTPAVFKRLGEVPARSVGELSRVTAPFRERLALHVREGEIRWHGADGTGTVAAAGIGFDVAPVRIPGREMYHHSLHVFRVSAAGGETAEDVEAEWLADKDIEYLELGLSGGKLPVAGSQTAQEDAP